MPAPHLTSAADAFSAARRISALPPGHPGHRLHGHNFRVGALLRDPSVPGPGAVSALQSRLARVLDPLRHADLNGLLAQPTDAALARWIGTQLGSDCLHRLSVASTDDHGADLLADGSMAAWRRYRFESAHRLPNVPAGHKCGRMHGHGFAALVRVRCPGSDEAAGAHERIDRAWAPLGGQLDHQCLNALPGLENPTSELLAAWLWRRLQPALQDLERVSVFETASCGACHDGHAFRIWKDFTLDSAMQCSGMPDSAAPARLHGHTYLLRLVLQAPLDTVLGWTIDFGDVKAVFDPVFRRLDHHPLHELPEGRGGTPAVAQWIVRTAGAKLPALSAVELYETAGCGVIQCAAGRSGADLLDLPPVMP